MFYARIQAKLTLRFALHYVLSLSGLHWNNLGGEEKLGYKKILSNIANLTTIQRKQNNESKQKSSGVCQAKKIITAQCKDSGCNLGLQNLIVKFTKYFLCFFIISKFLKVNCIRRFITFQELIVLEWEGLGLKQISIKGK